MRKRALQSEAPRVGVLAWQGAFAKHLEMLRKMHIACHAVRSLQELELCDALIIPGGESTTLEIVGKDLLEAITSFKGPIFGTCAGAILLAKLGLIDIDVLRNGYGRQIASKSATISFQGKPLEAIFIRAPIITEVGALVNVLASYDGTAVAVEQGRYLATTFHPELTEDNTFHDYWLKRLFVTS